MLILFQQISIVSPLANAVAIPVVTFTVVPLALASMAVPWDPAGRCFPAPQALAAAAIDDIAALGIVRARAAAIVHLARAWPELLPLLAPGAAPAPLVERLRALPGIGPWTAHYIAMRALGWSDAFPPGDVALLKALGLGKGAAAERAADERSRAWQPWRAYATVALWSRSNAPFPLENLP